MHSKLSQAILEAEWIGLILYIVLVIVGAAIVTFVALSSNDLFSAFNAGVSLLSGLVILSIIAYLETHVWSSE